MAIVPQRRVCLLLLLAWALSVAQDARLAEGGVVGKVAAGPGQIECRHGLRAPTVDGLTVVSGVGDRRSWRRATDMPSATVGGGPKGRWASFERPLPRMLDPSFLTEALDTFNREQLLVPSSLCHGTHCNDFKLEGGPFVVALRDAFVDSEGLVYDDTYAYPIERMSGTHELPVIYDNKAGFYFYPHHKDAQVTCVDKLLTILQPYQENYYHFVVESLPRLIMARDIMLKDPSIQLLTRINKPFIFQLLDMLGIPRHRVQSLGSGTEVFHANTVYVPTPTKIFAPPQENLMALHQHLAASIPVRGPRNLVIYTSREGSWSRDVLNQKEVLLAISAFLQKTDLELVVFDGALDVEETIALFKRAVMVIGPHGAGMTNLLWTSAGTRIVEFLHMTYPLLCYWHMATAMGLEYWMLPVPESEWAGHFEVPVQEVVDIMRASLRSYMTHDYVVAEHCPAGTSRFAEQCVPCPPGTYAYLPGSTKCALCAPGQYASGLANTHCSMCPPESYSDQYGATSCTACSSVGDGNSAVVWGRKSASKCPAPASPHEPLLLEDNVEIPGHKGNDRWWLPLVFAAVGVTGLAFVVLLKMKMKMR